MAMGMASQQNHNKLPFPGVPCFCTILLLIISSPLCCSAESNQKNYLEAYTLGSKFKETDGLLFLTNSSSTVSVRRGALGSYMGTDDPAFNLSANGWFFILQPIFLWNYRDYGTGLNEASFNFRFTMSINQTKAADSSLAFAIHPDSLADSLGYPSSFPPNPNGASDYTSSTVSGSHISAQISTVYGTADDPRNISLVQIAMASPGNSSSRSNYSVWIDYDHVEHRMSVSVDAVDGTPSTATAIVKMSDIMPTTASFGFHSSMGQLLQLDSWSLTAERLPYSFPLPPQVGTTPPAKGNRNIIVFSVLGSAAAVAITAAAAYLYFNSKYRRWKKEQDKLAKTMQRLPGVPTQVDYADIKRATKSFHESMKLGKGGFGAVYRCTLPAASLRRGRGMEVAVKKFTRDVEDQRYDDFLAEVSIINRLRHKNIVPLVGWSYNKGEPLLIYEYMTNGSLDQHLFPRGIIISTRQQQQQQQEESTCLGQWHTRYGIARDIATGLHYVHHEHEPMVLHRDIKASNIMLDSTFRARLGDFGIACTVAVNRSSVTGVAGTFGYIAPDYAMRHKATRQTDTYAFGVLILEVVTGKKNGDVGPDDDHITDWVGVFTGKGSCSRLLTACSPQRTVSWTTTTMTTSSSTKLNACCCLDCHAPTPTHPIAQAWWRWCRCSPSWRRRRTCPLRGQRSCGRPRIGVRETLSIARQGVTGTGALLLARSSWGRPVIYLRSARNSLSLTLQTPESLNLQHSASVGQLRPVDHAAGEFAQVLFEDVTSDPPLSRTSPGSRAPILSMSSCSSARLVRPRRVVASPGNGMGTGKISP